MSTVQTSTENTNTRKGRTAATALAKPKLRARSSKISAAKRAGGRKGNDTHSTLAASKVGRKPRTAAMGNMDSIVKPPQSTISPRADDHSKPMNRSRAATHSDGQYPHGARTASAVAHSTPDVAAVPALQPMAITPQHRDTIANINVNWRFRQGIVKAMTKLSLQAQACLRVGGSKEDAAKHYAKVAKDPTHADYIKIMPYLEAQQPLAKHRADYEKMLVKDVKTLPIYQWAKGVSGLGDVSLAGVIGECSGVNLDTGEFWSIGDMKSVSAVWKRMGLAVINGGRQRRVTGDEALEHGYVATRRAVMWNIGECIVKAQWRKENTVHAYGKLYGAMKARLQERNEAGEFADTASDIAARMKKTGSKPLAENLAGRLTPGHINNRAKRHMTKRLVRDLWVAWREADRNVGLNTAPKLA